MDEHSRACNMQRLSNAHVYVHRMGIKHYVVFDAKLIATDPKVA